jgi:hypothetical protein
LSILFGPSSYGPPHHRTTASLREAVLVQTHVESRHGLRIAPSSANNRLGPRSVGLNAICGPRLRSRGCSLLRKMAAPGFVARRASMACRRLIRAHRIARGGGGRPPRNRYLIFYPFLPLTLSTSLLGLPLRPLH